MRYQEPTLFCYDLPHGLLGASFRLQYATVQLEHRKEKDVAPGCAPATMNTLVWGIGNESFSDVADRLGRFANRAERVCVGYEKGGDTLELSERGKKLAERLGKIEELGSVEISRDNGSANKVTATWNPDELSVAATSWGQASKFAAELDCRVPASTVAALGEKLAGLYIRELDLYDPLYMALKV
jgi:hypothetical protein